MNTTLKKKKKKEKKSGAESSAVYTEKLAALREKHPRAYTPWSDEDDTALKAEFAKDENQQKLSKKLGRQPSAIRARLIKLGLIEEDI